MYKKTAVAAACVEIAENPASLGACCGWPASSPVEDAAERWKKSLRGRIWKPRSVFHTRSTGARSNVSDGFAL